jgi:hypothetical protein
VQGAAEKGLYHLLHEPILCSNCLTVEVLMLGILDFSVMKDARYVSIYSGGSVSLEAENLS